MVIATNEKLTVKGDALSFDLQFIKDGACIMAVKGCRIVKGYMWGPAYRTKGGGLSPQVIFYGSVREDALRAIKATGWSRAYTTVQFPAEAQSE